MLCSHVYSHHTVGAVYYHDGVVHCCVGVDYCTVGVVRTVKGDMANASK